MFFMTSTWGDLIYIELSLYHPVPLSFILMGLHAQEEVPFSVSRLECCVLNRMDRMDAAHQLLNC